MGWMGIVSVNQSPPYLGAKDKIVDTGRRPEIHQTALATVGIIITDPQIQIQRHTEIQTHIQRYIKQLARMAIVTSDQQIQIQTNIQIQTKVQIQIHTQRYTKQLERMGIIISGG